MTIDHTWPESFEVHAILGLPDDARDFETVGPSPLAVAITAQVHALARLHPPGTKILIGRRWVKRMNRSAAEISEQTDGFSEK